MPNIEAFPTVRDDWALFLDVDGTLIDIALTPVAATPNGETIAIIEALVKCFAGAVALVSGRPINDLDRLFAPLRLPAAGIHGFQRRTAAGVLVDSPLDASGIARARDALSTIERDLPGVLVEDKGASIAVHYRQAFDCKAKVLSIVRAAVEGAGGHLSLLLGKMVAELRAPGPNKGDAVTAFMSEPPFAGRVPVFIGDDVTDEDGFRVVNSLGGHSIRIGGCAESAARNCLADTSELRAWLRKISEKSV